MRAALLLLAALAAAAPALADSAAERQPAVVRAARERDRLTAERQRRQAEAAAAAAGIRALDEARGAAHAGGELSRRLREFERIAARLDDAERALAEQERRLARARADFAAAADVEERALEQRAAREGPSAVSAALAALAEQRRALAQAEPPSFRPPLDVALEPTDGPAEIETKLAVIDGEAARVAARLGELQREEALLTTRVAAKREWAREVAAARRDAAGSVELLDRSYEQAQSALRDLGARSEAVTAERAALEKAAAALGVRRREAEERQKALTKGHGTR